VNTRDYQTLHLDTNSSKGNYKNLTKGKKKKKINKKRYISEHKYLKRILIQEAC
jgi:hypothetical protein